MLPDLVKKSKHEMEDFNFNLNRRSFLLCKFNIISFNSIVYPCKLEVTVDELFFLDYSITYFK